jgi:hypothetical protein
MKLMRVSFLLVIVPLLLLSGRAQETVSPTEVVLGEEFTLKVGQQIRVRNTKLKLTFLSVPQDSRCPASVVCAWAGNAQLNLEVKKKKNVSDISLNTLLDPKIVTYKGFKLRLVKLSPYPATPGAINPGDYEATLVITDQ